MPYLEKKIYPFHQQMVQKHIQELINTKETICNSPYLRRLIYTELEKKKIKFTTEIVGYGKVIYNMSNRNSFDYKANPKIIMSNLKRDLYKKDVIYEDWHSCDPTNTEELSKLFEKNVSDKEKYEILIRFSNDELGGKFKSHIFDHPRKTIKKIIVQSPFIAT